MSKVTSKEQLPSVYQESAAYIVSNVKDYSVEVTHFFELLRKGKKEAHKLDLTDILKHKLVGDDGIEVDLSLGALVQVSIDNAPGGGIATHIANVGPSDERGMIQYAWAKSILGIGGPIKIADTDRLLETEGQFRKRGMDVAKGDVN